MKTPILLFLLSVAGIGWTSPVGWRNLDDAHRQGGRKVSENYLQGKIVLVCRDVSMASRMEEIWKSFKTKQFILLGIYEQSVSGATYPQYSQAGLTVGAPDAPLYVVSETGKPIYFGKDDRRATEVVVTALTDLDFPKSMVQMKLFLGYELAELPGRAMLRLSQLKNSYPQEYKKYAAAEKELAAVPDVKKLAELVDFAKTAKDFSFDPKKIKTQKPKFLAKVKSALSKYAFLKDSKDPRVVREAKNALADLKWTEAAL